MPVLHRLLTVLYGIIDYRADAAKSDGARMCNTAEAV